jgi:large subunit ribosomal protein L25
MEVLVHEVQKNPVSGDFTHIDFYAITAGQKIHVNIPVKFVGESQAKRDGAIVEEHMTEIEVKCSPSDLVDFFEVDITQLAEMGDNIKVEDLKIDTKKYEILSDGESVIISANEPAAEEDLSAPVVLELPKDEKEEAKKAQDAAREKESKGGKE